MRTGGCDGCGAAGAHVTAMPEEHEDMPRGEDGVSRTGYGAGLGEYIYIHASAYIYIYMMLR